MALISTSQVNDVLRQERGLSVVPTGPPQAQGRASKLEKLLSDASLTPEECLENLSSLMRSAEQDNTRLQAVKVGLELNQLIEKEGRKSDFIVNIQINNSLPGEPDLPDYALNPILVPRLT